MQNSYFMKRTKSEKRLKKTTEKELLDFDSLWNYKKSYN